MKKILLIFTAALFCISNAWAVETWDGTSSSAWTNGEGTESNPYLIETPAQLKYLSNQVKEGTLYTGKCFLQTQDFDLNSKDWSSIGTSTYKFEGKYNGGDKYVSNFTNSLFGYTNNATIENLSIRGNVSCSSSQPSILISEASGATILTNCHNFATVSFYSSENKNSAGFVAKVVGTSLIMNNCSNEGIINQTGYSKAGSLGGLIGKLEANATIRDCSNKGSLTISSTTTTEEAFLGGIVGFISYANVSFNRCYNTAELALSLTYSSMNSLEYIHTYVGGICGRTTISEQYTIRYVHCSNVGRIESKALSAGGYSSHSGYWAYAYGLGTGSSQIGCYVRASCSVYAYGNGGVTGVSAFGASEVESCYYVGGTASIQGSNVYHNIPSASTGIYKSEMAFKAPSMIPLLNSVGEYFTMDLEGINDGYPIFAYQVGQRHTITATCDANRGSVSGGGEFPNGYVATLTATPKSGCTFIGWSDGNTDNPRSVTVAGNATYTAQFTKSSYTIYVNQDCTSNIE